MITLKSAREIEIMARAGRIVAGTLALMREIVRPGMTTEDLDVAAEKYIRGHDGAVPSFKGLYGFPKTLCISIDEEIVQRLSGRTVCEKCQTPYTGKEPGSACTKPGCGGTVARRKDDEPEAIRNRLAVYRAQTAPVLDWYQGNGAAVHTIDAVGAVQDVTKRALRTIGH